MFTKFAKVGCLVLGLAVDCGTAAQAGQPPHYHPQGHTHDGYGIPHGGYGAPVHPYRTHLDYHPGGLVPHQGHYDYVPGHYDVHRASPYRW